MKIWVLHIRFYGCCDTYTFDSWERAEAHLVAWARNYWKQDSPYGPPPADDAELLERFVQIGDVESWDITETRINHAG